MPSNPAAENFALIWNSLRATLRGVVSFGGRSRRSDVWIYHFAGQFLAMIVTALAGVVLMAPDKDLLRQGVSLLLSIPVPALFVRRMHDVGLAGWRALLLSWPLIERLGVLIERALPGLPYPFLTAGPVSWIGIATFIVGLGIVLLAPSKPDRL